MRALVSGLAVIASLAAAPAAAQYLSPYNPNQQFPQGSYLNSCTSLQLTGSGANARLTATCRGLNGRSRTSTLAYRQCTGDIGNNNGILVCNGAPAASLGGVPDRAPPPEYGRPNDGLPSGNWRQSCTERRMERVWVKAQCLTNNGRRVLAEANWERCPTFSYSNIDGRLICDEFGNARAYEEPYDNAVNTALPGGEWRRSCQGVGLADRGNVVTASCRDERGNLRQSSVDLRTCRNRVLRNDGGYLRCG